MSPARYIASILAVAAVCLASAWVFADRMGMAFLESGYPVVLAKRSLIDECRTGDLVVLGDSRGEAAIIPAKMPVLSANLAIGALGPVESYFIARHILRCPHVPRLVLYTPSIVLYEHVGQGLWQRAAKYGLLSYSDLREIAGTAARLHDPSLDNVSTGDGLDGWLRDVAYAIRFPSIFTSSALDARFFGRYQSNIRELDAITKSRGHVVYPDGTGKPIVGADATVQHFRPDPVVTFYVDATLRMLSNAGIHTVVLPIPVAAATEAAMRPAVKQDAIRYMADHASGVAHVTDAFTRIEAWPDRLFGDGSHLDKAGADLYSDRLAVCVAAWLRDSTAACDMTWHEAPPPQRDSTEKSVPRQKSAPRQG